MAIPAVRASATAALAMLFPFPMGVGVVSRSIPLLPFRFPDAIVAGFPRAASPPQLLGNPFLNSHRKTA